MNLTSNDVSDFSSEDLLSAVCCLLTLVRKHMFIPGCIENWIVLIDAGQISFSSSQLDVKQK